VIVIEKYELSKPFEFEGQTYYEVELNFDAITGEVVEAVQEQFREIYEIKKANLVPEFDKRYQRLIAQIATGLPETFFKQLYGTDYSAIMAMVLNFLT